MSRRNTFSNEAFMKRLLNPEALIKLHSEKQGEKKGGKELRKILGEVRKDEKRGGKELRKILGEVHKDEKKGGKELRKILGEVRKGEKKGGKELRKILGEVRKDKDKMRHKSITCGKHLSSKGDELDQSEKSDFTVELNSPEHSSSVCNLENTLKRKRQDGDLLDGTKTRKIVCRIRLPLKRSEPDSSLTKQQQEAVKIEPPIVEPPPCQDPKIKLLEQTEVSIDQLLPWVPPSWDEMTQNIVVDEDWLFGSRKQERKQESRQLKSPQVTPSWPPRVMYLPEADIYALPYTVPF